MYLHKNKQYLDRSGSVIKMWDVLVDYDGELFIVEPTFDPESWAEIRDYNSNVCMIDLVSGSDSKIDCINRGCIYDVNDFYALTTSEQYFCLHKIGGFLEHYMQMIEDQTVLLDV